MDLGAAMAEMLHSEARGAVKVSILATMKEVGEDITNTTRTIPGPILITVSLFFMGDGPVFSSRFSCRV